MKKIIFLACEIKRIIANPLNLNYRLWRQDNDPVRREAADSVAVRNAFKDYEKGCFYNMLGLWASSFNTDNW